MKTTIYGLGLVLALAICWLLFKDNPKPLGWQQVVRDAGWPSLEGAKIQEAAGIYLRLYHLQAEQDSCRLQDELVGIDKELNRLLP